MPPKTRSQTVRETISSANTPQIIPLEQHHQDRKSRLRQEVSTSYLTNDTTWRPPRSSAPDEPPRFTIDLSLPPEQRYLEVCAAFRRELRNLTPLFDEVVSEVSRYVPPRLIKLVCKMLLRGVKDTEETRELRGISRVTGVDMYLLVSFNVLLDLFMGCSSGGAAVRDEEGLCQDSKMVHFRTLDWGMPSLRKVIVHLDFVAKKGGSVIAESITYAGFVGVLTGVRKDFSLSLNFREQRNGKGKFGPDLRYFWHLLMVLIGQRRSIASELRRMLLPLRCQGSQAAGLQFLSYSDVIPRQMEEGETEIVIQGRRLKTTTCYLCFSNGKETTVLEKDIFTAFVRKSKDLVVVTNSDIADQAAIGSDKESAEQSASGENYSPYAEALADIIHEAQDRKECAEHNYQNQRAAKARQSGTAPHDTAGLRCVMGVDDIVQLVQKYPTTNESTHFACVMDPKQGRIRWCGRWIKPVSSKWIREHQSDTW